MMKKFKLYLLLSFILAFFNTCSYKDCFCINQNSKSFAGELDTLHSTSINTIHILKELKKGDLSIVSGLQLIKFQQKDYIAYLNNRGIIVLINITNDADKIEANISKLIDLSDYQKLFFSDDTLRIIESKKKKYIQINHFTSLNNYDTSSFFFGNKIETSTYIKNPLNNSSISFLYPNFYISYGRSDRRNLIDKTPFLQLNILTQGIKKIGEYPNCYFDCYQRNSDGFIKNFASEIYYCFDQSDNLYRMSNVDSAADYNEIIHHCNFKAFDQTQNTNLAYSRKFLENCERNIGFLVSESGYFIVFKQTEKKKLSEKKLYELFLFDKTLNQIKGYSISDDISSTYQFIFKNQFACFSEDFSKLLLYEIK